MTRHTLCLLAHQDDEIAVASMILSELRDGGRVRCVYLTDGTAGGVEGGRRDRESLAALASLDVPADDVVFLGTDDGDRVADGVLVDSLEPTWARLLVATRDWPIDQILSPAYEGGHMDHDAAAVLALALAAARGIDGPVWQFPLYHGWKTRGGLFRVMAATLPGQDVVRHRIPRRTGLRISALVRHHRTQWKTWVGLSPEMVLRLVAQGRSDRVRADADLVRRPPHEGRVFYERRFGVAYDDWRTAVDAFLVTHSPWKDEVDTE